MSLEDVQGQVDARGVAIDDVGIRGFRHPVTVCQREGSVQATVAEVSLAADLSPSTRGSHLSRFVELLRDHHLELSVRSLPDVLKDIAARLQATRSAVSFTFPFFVNRVAPASGESALLEYRAWLRGRLRGDASSVVLGAKVPVTSVCPCSKAVSDYGAHNQRGSVAVEVKVAREGTGSLAMLWAEDLIDWSEAAGSAPVLPLVKRPDERMLTMQAFDNPVFVEDMVRTVATTLSSDERVAAFSVEAENDESIHHHAAFARVVSSNWSDGSGA